MAEIKLKTFRDVKVGDTVYDFSNSDKWIPNLVTDIRRGYQSMTFYCVDCYGINHMLFIPNYRINDIISGNTTAVDDEEFVKKHELYMKAKRMMTDNRWVRRNHWAKKT